MYFIIISLTSELWTDKNNMWFYHVKQTVKNRWPLKMFGIAIQFIYRWQLLNVHIHFHCSDRNEFYFNKSIIYLYRKLRTVLTARLLKFFQDQSKKDTAKYMKFYEDYGLFFREGIVTTPEQEQRVIKLDITKTVTMTTLLDTTDGYLSSTHRTAPHIPRWRVGDVLLIVRL